MKKAISLLASAVMIMCLGSEAMATSSALEMEASEILSNFSVIRAEDVPEGVVPLVFDSDEEAVAYIQSAFNSNQEITSVTEIGKSDGRSKILHGSFETSWPGAYYINLISNYDYINPYMTGELIGPTQTPTSDNNLQSVAAGCWLSGITLAVELSLASCGASPTNEQSYHAYANGAIDTYLLIDGLIKLYSTNFSAGYDYNIRTNVMSNKYCIR